MVLVTPAHEGAGNNSPDKKKKTKLQTTSSKDEEKRRLVEYFVVVSSIPQKQPDDDDAAIQEASSFEGSREDLAIGDDEDVYIDDFDFQPKITARFPLEDHNGNPLHESVTFFCHPTGNIQLRTAKSMPKVSIVIRHGWLGSWKAILVRTSLRRFYPTVKFHSWIVSHHI